MSYQPGHILTDKQLVDLVLSGDRYAFDRLIKSTEGLVAQIVFKLVSNEEDRKDMVQDIYLKVYHHLKGFKFQSKLSTWVAQIAYNSCFNRLQKKQLPVYFPPDEDWDHPGGRWQPPGLRTAEEPDTVLLQKELNSFLQAAIARLPPLYQTLISLYHHEELSYQEIGQITALPEGTVKSYLFRARKQLKENCLSYYKKEKL